MIPFVDGARFGRNPQISTAHLYTSWEGHFDKEERTTSRGPMRRGSEIAEGISAIVFQTVLDYKTGITTCPDDISIPEIPTVWDRDDYLCISTSTLSETKV